MNLGCGYYQQHRDTEYVVIEEVMKSLSVGKKLIEFLGIKKYLKHDVIKESSDNFGDAYGYDWEEDDFDVDVFYSDDNDERANKIVESVVDMYESGYSKDDIKLYISELLSLEDYG